MADKMEIVERTEPITIEEVFDFIDDTSIGKMDAHELKSRIADMEHEVRAKAFDECMKILSKYKHDFIGTMPYERFMKDLQHMKAGGKHGK